MRACLVRLALPGLLGGALVYAGLVSAAAVWARAARPPRPCPRDRTVVLVSAASHTLCLCRAGQAEGVFRVALGSRGVGKRREGDRRTPLGTYALSRPRRSAQFTRFVPVGYPTAEQARAGHTGGAIGIHGPHAAFAWLGHATVWLDWTAGCIALGTVGEVEEVADWLRRTEAREIVIS